MFAYVGLIQNLQDLLDDRREQSALEGWILEVLYCDQNGSRAFLRILSTDGRGVWQGVRLWREYLKPEGPTGLCL